MPTRRSIGRGMMAASAILSDYFQREATSNAISRRQVADDERARIAAEESANRAATLARETEYLKQNPSALASSLGRSRPNEDVAAPLSEQITKADNLSKMPTDIDVENQYRTGGGRTTLSSENISGAPSNLIRTPNKGGREVLNELMAQAKAKRDTLTSEARIPDTKVTVANPDGSTTDKFVSKRDGGEYQTGLSAVQEGKLQGDKAQAAAPGEGQAALTVYKATEDAKFKHEQRVATMQAALDLKNWKEKNALTASAKAKEAAAAATAGILNMEEIIALAHEVNKSNIPGVADAYSGMKGGIAQLPYVGPSLGTIMDTANASVIAMQSGDPSIISKVNQLQAMRRSAAISVIRAAGDTRPSNADVDGVINMIPGAGESLFATANKSKMMRDTFTLIPEMIDKHPELVGDGKGFALIQATMNEAKARSEARAKSGRTELGSKPATPTASEKLSNVRSRTATPPSISPPPKPTAAQRLQALREAKR